MEWSELYGRVHQPANENFSEYVNSDLWLELNSYLQETYHILPQIEYSGCSMQKGWNIKYRKGGKSLCTLYPMQGYFIALAVIGEREINEAELLMPLCSEYTQNLFKQTVSGYSGKWMMIDVKKTDVLHDVKKIIELRVSWKF
ncbi:MAG TPA: hypothetical protein DC053_10920 [Lachnoclostridium sp.]|jgi:hypothetical protein|nr:hypothetical protein [Lachnoclostridium sp.]